MKEIIFGYKNLPVWKGGYSFSVYEDGIVNYEKLSVKRLVIESKEIVIPKSVVEDVEKCLIKQKILIDKFPEKQINSGFLIDGAIDYFNFIGNEIYCWNILRMSNEDIYKMELKYGKFSLDTMNIVQLQNNILEVFESAYKFLKNYGLKVYSWNHFHCDWEM